jgi:hypothetical protein
MNARGANRFPFAPHHFHRTFFKTGIGCRPYLLEISSSQEIVMTSFRIRFRMSRSACATLSAATGLLWVGAALASQGPGGGPGTAGGFTQLAMAIIVYGTAALVVGAGLIGAARRGH